MAQTILFDKQGGEEQERPGSSRRRHVPIVRWDGTGVNATVTTTPQEADNKKNNTEIAAGATVRLFILLLWVLLPSPPTILLLLLLRQFLSMTDTFSRPFMECPTDCVTPLAESMKNRGGSDL